MIYVIGDTQVKPDVKNPLFVIAHHICDVKPHHVIHMGDHWDLPSLSYWDKGKKSKRPLTYKTDMLAGNFAMEEFWMVIKKRWPKFKEECTFILLRGNHEERRNKALEFCEDQYVDLIEDVKFDDSNWDMVIPFLDVAKIHGIEFSHYFQNTGSSKPISTARQLINKRHTTCIAGHKQGFEYEEMLQGQDSMVQAMIVGSSYYHKEGYLTHNNHHWRGVVLLYNLNNTTGFDYARYSMETLDMLYESQKR